jgi:hypothetical protein
MAHYEGRDAHDVFVVDDEGRRSRLPHVAYHSPTGFSWGYGGSGPADLALSILAHHLGVTPTQANPNRTAWHYYADDHPARLAFRLHQPFKWDIVARFEVGDPWVLTTEEVAHWIARRGVAR